jgi:hypothetical protein
VESQTALQLKHLKQLSDKHHGLTVSRVNQRFALTFSDSISESLRFQQTLLPLLSLEKLLELFEEISQAAMRPEASQMHFLVKEMERLEPTAESILPWN